jgi:hypothetical protein
MNESILHLLADALMLLCIQRTAGMVPDPREVDELIVRLREALKANGPAQ